MSAINFALILLENNMFRFFLANETIFAVKKIGVHARYQKWLIANLIRQSASVSNYWVQDKQQSDLQFNSPKYLMIIFHLSLRLAMRKRSLMITIKRTSLCQIIITHTYRWEITHYEFIHRQCVHQKHALSFLLLY